MRPGHMEGSAVASRPRISRERFDRAAFERELAKIVASASDAIVSADPDGNIRTWNAGAERLFGYAAAEVIGEPFSRLVPSRDLPRGREVVSHVRSGRPIPEFDAQALRKDGAYVDVSLTVSPIADGEGRLTGMVAIARDIGERKRADTARRQAQRRFAAAFSNAPIGMALVSLEGRFIDVNPSLCELLGRPETELCTLTFQELTHPDDLEDDLALVAQLVAGAIPRFETEKRYLRPDGSVVWGQLCVSLVRGLEGEAHHFVSQIKDITAPKQQDIELRRLAEHLEGLSLHDPLTGLGNPRAFDRDLERALDRAAGGDGRFAVVQFDVDDLKAHNAAHGRLDGDRQLCLLAEVMLEAAGGCGEAFRIGGDELALLIEDADRAEAELIAERIALAIEESAVEVGVSWAVASYPQTGSTRADLLSRAEVFLHSTLHGSRPRSRPDATSSTRASERGELILATACRQLGVSATCLSEAADGEDLIRLIGGDGESFGLRAGAELPTTEAIVASIAVPCSDGDPSASIVLFSHEPRAPLTEREEDLLRFLGGLVTEALRREAEDAREHMAEMELSGVTALVAALEARDHYTAEHSKGVVQLATAVARRLELDEGCISEVERVAVLHDIGKVAVPDAILQKNGPLTRSEWDLMRQHPAVGERIVAATKTLAHLAAPIRGEHEHFDGGGYPDGLRGERIPIASRITLACDAYHAMTSERPYRRAMGDAEAREELARNAGSQFDPAVVAALLEELGAADR